MTNHLLLNIRDFSLGLMFAGLSWGCWGLRTVGCVKGDYWLVSSLAGIEEAIALGSVLWIVRFKTWAGATGCCVGAALGAGIATWFQ